MLIYSTRGTNHSQLGALRADSTLTPAGPALKAAFFGPIHPNVRILQAGRWAEPSKAWELQASLFCDHHQAWAAPSPVQQTLLKNVLRARGSGAMWKWSDRR